MTAITDFCSSFVQALPHACELLKTSNLVVHPRVSKITLHGSRGAAGGYREDSDIDLALIVDTSEVTTNRELEPLLREILETTLRPWTGAVEADLAAIFDKSDCGLDCLDLTEFDESRCDTVVNCLGIYKTQKGFDGFVTGPAADVRAMYPCITIWVRD